MAGEKAKAVRVEVTAKAGINIMVDGKRGREARSYRHGSVIEMTPQTAKHYLKRKFVQETKADLYIAPDPAEAVAD